MHRRFLGSSKPSCKILHSSGKKDTKMAINSIIPLSYLSLLRPRKNANGTVIISTTTIASIRTVSKLSHLFNTSPVAFSLGLPESNTVWSFCCISFKESSECMLFGAVSRDFLLTFESFLLSTVSGDILCLISIEEVTDLAIFKAEDRNLLVASLVFLLSPALLLVTVALFLRETVFFGSGEFVLVVVLVGKVL